MAGIRYRPEIDGLRALAVVPVVMFHLGLGFPGGFVGVDVFFVISGFLITGIIRRGLENETFSLAEFWERRIRRIFPAVFVVVAATLAIGYWLLLPNELEELGESSVAQALLLANVYFWRDTGYFAGPAEFKPLLHTWSLAVEEQFYLFFPLVLFFLRRLSSKKLFALLTAVALISSAGSVYGAFYHTGATFFLLPTRAWELLVGCMLAVFPWQCESSPRRDSAIATVGVLAIFLPVFLYDAKTPFPGLAAVPPVIGTAAIIFATAKTPRVWLCSVLSLRPFVFIGLISYSLYLWHWPVIVYTRMYFGHFHWKQIVFASVISISLAILSWRFIETPFRRTTFVQRRRRVLGTALFMSGTAVAISILLIHTGGLPSRFPNYSLVLLEDTTWKGDEYAISLSEDFDFDKLPTLGEDFDSDDQQLDFILWGDSHGRTICDVVNEVALELKLSGKAVVTSNVPGVPNICMPFNEGVPAREMLLRQKAVMKMLALRQPRNLLLVSRWSWYTNGFSDIESEGHARQHLLSDDEQGLLVSDPPEKVLSRNLEELVMFCEKNHIKLWILKQVPETKVLSPARELFLYSVGRTNQVSDARNTHVDHQRRQEKPENIFQREFCSDVRFLEPAPFLFDGDGNVMNYLDGRSLYRDNDHLTRWGTRLLRLLFKEAMLEMRLQEDHPRQVGNR